MEEMEAEVKEGWRRSKGVAEKRACVKTVKRVRRRLTRIIYTSVNGLII